MDKSNEYSNEKCNKETIKKILKLYYNGVLYAKYNILDARSKHDYSVKAISYDKTGPSGKTNNISREIERFIEVKDQAEQQAGFLYLLINDIEKALNVFSKEDYNLLKLSYSKMPDDQIANQLNMSIRNVYYVREISLNMISKLLDADYYLQNPLKDIADYFDDMIG